MYFKEAKGVANKIKEKRTAIEYELPRLVSHIEKTLKHNRDVLYILDNYKENAGPELKKVLIRANLVSVREDSAFQA